MIIPDEIIISSTGAAALGLSWFIKIQITEFKKIIDRNTEAFICISSTIERCKLKNEVK